MSSLKRAWFFGCDNLAFHDKPGLLSQPIGIGIKIVGQFLLCIILTMSSLLAHVFWGSAPKRRKTNEKLKESDAVAYDSDGSISDQVEFFSDDG